MSDPTFDELGHGYTGPRAKALDHGALIDVSDTAKNLGLPIPAAITRGVWETCVEWDDADRRLKAQSVNDRLHALLCSGLNAIGIQRLKRGRHRFEVECLPRDRQTNKYQPIELEIVIHDEDNPGLVATISRPRPTFRVISV